MYMANFSSDGSGPGAYRATPAVIIVVAVMVHALLTSTTADAHGIVGDRIFLSPIVGNDAFPDNALDLSVRRSNYAF